MNFLLKQIQKPSKDPNDHQALEEAQYAVAHKSWVGHKGHQSTNHSNPSQIDWGNTCAPSFPKRFVLPLAQCEQQVNIGFSPKATMKQHGHPPSNQRWNVQATERNGWSQSELTAPMFESLPYPKHQWKLQLSRFPKWKLRSVSPSKFWILHFTNPNSSNNNYFLYCPMALSVWSEIFQWLI